MSTDELISHIERYCAAHGVAESTFGRMAVNDGKLVARLRSGKTITLDTFRRVELFMSRPVAKSDNEAAA